MVDIFWYCNGTCNDFVKFHIKYTLELYEHTYYKLIKIEEQVLIYALKLKSLRKIYSNGFRLFRYVKNQ